ncbi:hypothetical protein M432DRAFT_91604 [Thermoascus aurantiacus ATCC 26904]
MLLPEHPRFLSVHLSACPLLSSHRVRHGLDPVAPGLDAVHRPGRGARGRLGLRARAPRPATSARCRASRRRPPGPEQSPGQICLSLRALGWIRCRPRTCPWRLRQTPGDPVRRPRPPSRFATVPVGARSPSTYIYQHRRPRHDWLGTLPQADRPLDRTALDTLHSSIFSVNVVAIEEPARPARPSEIRHVHQPSPAPCPAQPPDRVALPAVSCLEI